VQYGRRVPRSINDALLDAFLVLKYEKASRPEVFGASVSGLHDIFRRLLPFALDWRRDQPAGSVDAGRPLYCATVDIRHCYDSIPQVMLCDVVLPLVVRHPAYWIGKYSRVLWRPPPLPGPPRKRRKAGERLGRAEPRAGAEAQVAEPREFVVQYHHCAYPLTELDRHTQHTRGGQPAAIVQPWRRRQTILTNQESQVVVDREAVLAVIREHVTRNVIKVDGRYLQTVQGIPQVRSTDIRPSLS
jgi:telomerase reverse transcriptase